MKKIITVAILSLLSLFAHANEVIYQDKDVDKVSELQKGTWNYFKIDNENISGKFSIRVQDSQNKNDVAILFSKLKDNKKGLVEYPLIAFATDDINICKSCEVKVSFDNKTYETYQLQEFEKNEYKINKTGQFYKKFNQSKEVYIEFPKLGKYQYHFDDVSFDMPTSNWIVFDTIEESLNLPIHMNVLESNQSDGAISIYKTTEQEPMIGILLEDNFKCKKSECVLTVSFDNVKKTFTAFQFQSELMIDDSKTFISLLDTSNIIKITLNGSKLKKSYLFDNSIKDYK